MSANTARVCTYVLCACLLSPPPIFVSAQLFPLSPTPLSPDKRERGSLAREARGGEGGLQFCEEARGRERVVRQGGGGPDRRHVRAAGDAGCAVAAGCRHADGAAQPDHGRGGGVLPLADAAGATAL